jgi:hypothetical protein
MKRKSIVNADLGSGALLYVLLIAFGVFLLMTPKSQLYGVLMILVGALLIGVRIIAFKRVGR